MKRVRICLSILQTLEFEDNVTSEEIEEAVRDLVDTIDNYLFDCPGAVGIHDYEYEFEDE